jgi:hypothetical protein
MTGVEAGQVVFEDVNDAPLLLKRRPPQDRPSELLARDLFEGGSARPRFQVGPCGQHVPVQVARVDVGGRNGNLAALIRRHLVTRDRDVTDGRT